jgi:hypothetical protein
MRAIISALGLLPALVTLLFVSAPALAQSPPAPLASAQYSADPDLRCDILEVKRVSGGALNIRWRIINTAGAGGGLTGTTAKPINYNFGWDQIYFIDPSENKKYQYLTDSAGNRILEVFYGNLAAGQQRLNWAKFPAPPASSTKITIQIPHFAPFDDVPVSQ